MGLLSNRRNSNWIACIDFGTALSKIAMVKAVDRINLQPNHIKPLPVAIRQGFSPLNPYLLPSTIFVTDDHVLFGQEAEEVAIRNEASDRFAFVSPKQYLSTHDPEDLDQPLPSEIDPTGKFSAKDLLRLYLAHLLERAGNHAREDSLPWPVALRFARPAWQPERAQLGERTLKQVIRDGFALVDELGSAISANGGILHGEALAALKHLTPMTPAQERRIFDLSTNGTASVLEATAVAAGTVRETGRRVVAVADVGAGTSDFGAFMTGLPGRSVLAEIVDSSRILREAGDYLDMQLRRFLLDKAGLLPDDPAARGISNRLRARARFNKETLFINGNLTVEAGDDFVAVTAEEFLAYPHVSGFAERLRDQFHDTLTIAVSFAKRYSPRGGGQAPVEIMLTGGGHDLPMVRALLEAPSVPWSYSDAAPDLVEHAVDIDYYPILRQLAVAVGGAVRDLPVETAPLHD